MAVKPNEFWLYAEKSLSFSSIDELDAAFDSALSRYSGQITAETYGRTEHGQVIGRTHAYRLDNGRVFRRSLVDWPNAELTLSHEEPPIMIDITEIQSTLKAMEDAMKAKGLPNAEVSMAVLSSGYASIQIYLKGMAYSCAISFSPDRVDEAFAWISSYVDPSIDFDGPLVLMSA